MCQYIAAVPWFKMAIKQEFRPLVIVFSCIVSINWYNMIHKDLCD